MSKKKWAYLIIGVGLFMIYAVGQVMAAPTIAGLTATPMGKLENQAATLALTGAAPGVTTPYVAYGLLAAGAWLLFA